MIRHAKHFALPLVLAQLAGCATFQSHDNTLSCSIPVAAYPSDARPLDRQLTVLVRALISAEGEPGNVTVTTSSRNAAADRAAVAAMSRAHCTQHAADGSRPAPFTLTQPFVFEPAGAPGK
ncbi:TonB family protein [Burkholderia plantarii]|uniref:Putative lipoprotein n=1 Tax=Burkholderia plantarii TaxID=41899 RepID=A0A0B6RW28_BURPL|nr:TonB family protein [Burkholderia plantarii]AJK47613.1 putative lipoprotein [Burkholderia plantarii]ALK31804.1 TonB domain-containing protein [Burkholderia plantarii]WLE60541.1 TonB family protein [Burkholderia plantarii]GLZ22902.1 lipoprotein [Burkholderia plantarii]